MPDGTLERCCHADAYGMQTAVAGSFFVFHNGNASFSGALNRSQLWEYFQDTGDTQRGKFWFFSHNRTGPGRGVDVFLPCRVFRLVPFAMTEAVAWAHPKARAAADFWGEHHPEHQKVVASLAS